MSKDSVIPFNYEEWKYCITEKCGIPLTKDFIEERIASLKDFKNEDTKRFIKLYGDRYTSQIIEWFVLARHELENK